MFYQDGKDFCTRNFPSAYLKFLKSTGAEDWKGGVTEFYLLAGNKQGSACCLFHASLLLGLTSNTEDRDNIFLQSIV
jgi:hypothetical protein